VVIRLVPDGDRKPQVVEQGERIWESLSDVPAVKNHRVYVVSVWYGEMPGFRIGELAEKLAEVIHPEIMGAKIETRNPKSEWRPLNNQFDSD